MASLGFGSTKSTNGANSEASRTLNRSLDFELGNTSFIALMQVVFDIEYRCSQTATNSAFKARNVI